MIRLFYYNYFFKVLKTLFTHILYSFYTFTKINRNVTPKNIKLDCEGSLKRLGTDYIDVYQVSGMKFNSFFQGHCALFSFAKNSYFILYYF